VPYRTFDSRFWLRIRRRNAERFAAFVRFIEQGCGAIRGAWMVQQLKKADIAARLATLTNRQLQIAVLVCEGLSNKLIAHKLKLSEGTIKSHLHSIFDKLGVQSRMSLMIAFSSVQPALPVGGSKKGDRAVLVRADDQ
jgi:ATP/maltotriose-dependent transcriptional regulator MalT